MELQEIGSLVCPLEAAELSYTRKKFSVSRNKIEFEQKNSFSQFCFALHHFEEFLNSKLPKIFYWKLRKKNLMECLWMSQQDRLQQSLGRLFVDQHEERFVALTKVSCECWKFLMNQRRWRCRLRLEAATKQRAQASIIRQCLWTSPNCFNSSRQPSAVLNVLISRMKIFLRSLFVVKTCSKFVFPE